MKHTCDFEEYFFENWKYILLHSMKLHYHCLIFWQRMVCVVSELDQHTADFKGGSFPLSIVSSYNCCSKKKGENGTWRKVSTSPRKKSGHFSSPTWNKPDLNEEGKGDGHSGSGV